jgi:hypothetical protein
MQGDSVHGALSLHETEYRFDMGGNTVSKVAGASFLPGYREQNAELGSLLGTGSRLSAR